MPIFTAIATFVVGLTGSVFLGAVASFAAKAVLFSGISRLLGSRDNKPDAGANVQNSGGRVQLQPSTDNKLPVVYGTAYVAPVIIDAKISTDQQYMWYVCALAEVTTNASSPDSAYIFGDMYYGGKLVTLGSGGDAAKVLSLTTNTTPPQVDTKMDGKIYIYQFINGSSSGVNTGGATAITILSDAVTGGGIPVAARWGATDLMSNAAFVIVRVEYNQDASTTGLEGLQIQLINTYDTGYAIPIPWYPGSAIYDYMTNTRYGCAIPTAQIDLASLTALNVYSQEVIPFNNLPAIINISQANPAVVTTNSPHGLISGTGTEIFIGAVVGMTQINNQYYYIDAITSTTFALYDTNGVGINSTGYTAYISGGAYASWQARYMINGPIATGASCLSNLQQLVDSCDSWLQYSELTGQWKVVMNKPHAGVIGDLYAVDSDVLIGGIDINPIDLNQTYNSLEVQYPNTFIKDQTDFQVISLTNPANPWYDPTLISYNEPENRLTVQYQLVNSYNQSLYLGIRRLLQSREDLTINCLLDYSGIQVEAGDVVRVTLAEYGWTDKLFRVSQVQEAKLEDGSLGARIVGFEYNATVYTDNALTSFVPADNTGLEDPNVIGPCGTPTVTDNPLTDGNVASFKVSTTSPLYGIVLYIDFNYGTTSDPADHILYRTVSRGNGSAYPAGTVVSIDVTDLPPDTYYWSCVGRNNSAGQTSAATAVPIVWVGPSVTTFDPSTGNGGVRYPQLSTNGGLAIERTIGGTNWSVTFPVPNTVPVSVTSTATRNIPIYIPGTALSVATHIWPFYTGTSSTGTGTGGNQFYIGNSTGAMLGTFADLLYVADGNDGWYLVNYFNYPSGQGTISDTEAVFNDIGLTVTADAVPCTFQVLTGLQEYGDPRYVYFTEKLATYTITVANQPMLIEFKQNFYTTIPGVMYSYISSGVTIRNTSPGTNLYIINSQNGVSAGEIPY